MATFTKTVHKVYPKSKGNRTWLGITVDGKDGGTREENVFDDNVKAVFSAGPGVYELSYEKKDKFWNLVGAKCVKAEGKAVQVEAVKHETKAEAKDDQKANRAVLFSAALNAAVTLVVANKGKLDEDAQMLRTKALTGFFLRFGAEVVANGLPKQEVVEDVGPEAEVEGA